jgi:predicted acyl esterase
VAIPTTCPKTAPSGTAVSGASLAALAADNFVLRSTTAQTVTSKGGSPTVAAALDPTGQLCNPMPGTREPGTALYQKPVGSHPVHIIGAIKVTATIHVVGNYPELVGRLWDLSPAGVRQIVALGVVRPSVDQRRGTKATATGSETLTFDLNPNDYTFATGHTLQLELVGSSSPFYRASKGTYTITVNKLMATVPTVEAG